MTPHLELLEQLVRPLELVEMLGLTTSREQNEFTVVCPYCGSTCWITTSSLLCQNDACPMLAGSIMELALSAVPSKTYEDGAKLVWYHFENRLQRVPEFDRSTFVSNVAAAARARRRLTHFLRRIHAPTDVNGHRAAVLTSLSKQGLHDPGHHLIGVLLQSEQEGLASALEEHGLQTEKLPSRDLLCMVYWLNPHTPASILLSDPVRQWQTMLTLQPYRMAVCGLRLMTPKVQRVFMHDTAIDAGCRNRQWAQKGASALAMTYHFSGGDAFPPDLPQLVLAWHPHLSPALVSRFYTLFSDSLFVTKPDGKLLEYDALLFEVLTGHVRKEHFTRTGVTMLGHFNPQGVAKNKLHARLMSAGLVGCAEQVRRQLYNIVISQNERTALLETPDGYAMRRGNGPPELVSNFTIKLDANVVFGTHATPHHAAHILIGSEEHEVLLSSRLLDAPRELQDTLQLTLAGKGSTNVPMLRDAQVFKSVAFYLRGSVTRAPIRVGLPYLGWSFNRDSFYLPGLMLRSDGSQRGVFPLHPDLSVLNAYDAAYTATAGTPNLELPEELRMLALLIVGSVLRSGRNEQLQALHFKHDGNATAAVSAAFAGLGQRRALTKIEAQPAGLQGYPAWGTAGKVQGRIRTPYFLLTDHGISIHHAYEQKVLDQLGQVVHHLVTQAVDAMMAMPDPNVWHKAKAVLYSNSLAIEASEFLASHCAIKVPPTLVKFDWLELQLGRTNKAQLPALLSYDFGPQIIRWNLQTSPDIDPISLELELRQVSHTVRVQPDTMTLETDAGSTLNLLATYYGEMPNSAAG
mgnify:CR=1 FL=1